MKKQSTSVKPINQVVEYYGMPMSPHTALIRTGRYLASTNYCQDSI
jgi:hypothetical protein